MTNHATANNGAQPPAVATLSQYDRISKNHFRFTNRGSAMESHTEENLNRFEIERLEERIAPTIVPTNNGGNTPNGEANGVPNANPAGNEPPGWNK